MRKANFLCLVLVSGSVLALVFSRGQDLSNGLALNLAGLDMVEGSAGNHQRLESASDALERLSQMEVCRADWLLGLSAHLRGNAELRNAAWARLIRCQPEFIPYIETIAYEQIDLARLATQAQPDTSEGWFWLAELNAKEDPVSAIKEYQTGLQLSPTDGQRWKELGDILRQFDYQAAIEAYLQSCFHGDPGSNGCYQAGITAELQGDIETAIRYYRLSKWSGALDRAAQLEQGLNTPGIP